MRFLIALLLFLGLSIGLWGALGHVAASQPAGGGTVTAGDSLSLSLDEQGQITSLLLAGQELVVDPGPALNLRDLSHAGDETRPNLLATFNPSFEQGLSGWTQVKGLAPLTASITTTVAYSGANSLALHAPAGAAGLIAFASETVSGIAAGQSYRLSARFRSREGIVTSPSGTVFLWQRDIWEGKTQPGGIYALWHGSDGSLIGEPVLVGVLHTNANAWKKVGGEAAAPAGAVQVQVAVAARLDDDQTVWIDDVRLEAAPELVWPVLSQMVAGQGMLTQTASLSDSLSLTVTYRSLPDRIDISGVVRDSSGQPRALVLDFNLPVDLSGWLWWDDLRDSRVISQGFYANQLSAIYNGWLPMSLYSLAALENGGHGLALALPDLAPQVARLGYDAEQRRYQARFSLGISPLAAKLQQTARFDLTLYPFESGCAACPDGRRGFREAVARYNGWFGGRPHPQRDIYRYDGATRDFYLSPQAARQVITNNLNNILSTQYTALEFSLKITDAVAPRPDYQDVMAYVDAWGTTPHSSLTYSTFLSISNGVSIDTNGDRNFKLLSTPTWNPDKWVAIMAGDWDPDIAQGSAWITYLARVDQAMRMTEQVGAHLDGIFVDNYMSNPTIDVAPAHIALADHALTFHPVTYQPGLHTMAGVHEFLADLREHLDVNWGQDRAIVINFWGLGSTNSQAQFIDGFGSEGDPAKAGNWDPATLAYRRVIAGHRPRSFANQSTRLDDEGVRRFAAEALFWGVASSAGANASGWISNTANLQVLSDTNAALNQFWADGWEPLTNGASDQPGVWVERFGRIANAAVFSRTEAAGLAFTVHNSTDAPLSYTLSISGPALGIDNPAALISVTELVSAVQVPASASGALLQINGSLPGRRTAVYQLACLPADVNCDGAVDVVDIQRVAAHWQTEAPLRSQAARYDLDASRFVDSQDLRLASLRW